MKRMIGLAIGLSLSSLAFARSGGSGGLLYASGTNVVLQNVVGTSVTLFTFPRNEMFTGQQLRIDQDLAVTIFAGSAPTLTVGVTFGSTSMVASAALTMASGPMHLTAVGILNAVSTVTGLVFPNYTVSSAGTMTWDLWVTVDQVSNQAYHVYQSATGLTSVPVAFDTTVDGQALQIVYTWSSADTRNIVNVIRSSLITE